MKNRLIQYLICLIILAALIQPKTIQFEGVKENKDGLSSCKTEAVQLSQELKQLSWIKDFLGREKEGGQEVVKPNDKEVIDKTKEYIEKSQKNEVNTKRNVIVSSSRTSNMNINSEQKNNTNSEQDNSINNQQKDNTNIQPKVASNNLPLSKSEVQKNKRLVYLTIDDGPSGNASELLDILKSYKVRATFFMLEPNVRAYPSIVRRMVEEGHVFGIHGVTHDKDKFYKSKEALLNEVSVTRSTIKTIAGIDTILVRTPYGSVPYMTGVYKEALNTNGYKMWDWNIDSRDWFYRDRRYVTSIIEQLGKLGNQQIPVILVHDRVNTIELLPELLEYLIANDFEFGTLNKDMRPVQFG